MSEHNVGRPEWQRSEANVIYTRLAQAAFDGIENRVDGSAIQIADAKLTELGWHVMPDVQHWRIAAKTSLVMDEVGYENDEFCDLLARLQTPKITEMHERYTYGGTVERVFQEAFCTSAYLPSKYVRALDRLHLERHNWSIAYNVSDVVKMINSPELPSHLNQLSLAANGYWSGGLSDTYMQSFLSRRYGSYLPTHNYIDAPDTTLKFRLDMGEQLQKLRQNNSSSQDPPMSYHSTESMGGNRSHELSKAASAGCPVRYKKPSFTTETTKRYRTRLVRALGVPREEIEQANTSSAIELGLEAYRKVMAKIMTLSRQGV